MTQKSSIRAASISALLATALGGAFGIVSAQSACTAGQTSAAFSFTGAVQTFSVPAGVTSAVVHVNGAQGGNGGGAAGGIGGLGASVVGTLALTPGATLNIYVGGGGSSGLGFNGGGSGGNIGAGTGGGASDIRVGGTAAANRVVTAGGGGGGGSTGCVLSHAGGAGGAGGGGAGTKGVDSPNGGGGFQGTGATAGGAGIGCGGFLGSPGVTSTGPNGGNGGNGQGCCCASTPGGGGGGGGFVGGGGGGGGSAGTVGCSGNDKGGGGGGAGGTSDASALTAATVTNGVNLGNGSVELCYVPDSADLSITKTDGVTSVTAGGSTTYTIVASNAGPSGVTGATVADTFPASLTCTWTCAGAGGGTCTASGSGNINDTVNLPSGGSVTYTAVCAISPSATGTLANTATVNSATSDPTPGNNTATDTDTITQSADLSITKTDGVTNVTAGGSTTYTIVASNAGPSNVSGATVADTFPASLTCTWTCAGAGGGTCTASGSGNINDTVNLPVGGSVSYTAVCSISTSATGSLVNTATVSSSTADPTPANNSATDTNTILVPANGACGTANGVAVGVAPTANLCADASSPTVTSSASQFTWTCNGVNGGANASCAAPRTYTVTPSVSGGNGTATGGGVVGFNNTGTVTITPNAGFFTVTPIGGTCGGSLSGTTFTTAPVTADCTVIASFTAAITPGVAASPAQGGSVSCTPQAVIGGTSTCTISVNPGFLVASVSGCGGVLSSPSTYVTGPMTSACVVSVAFVAAAGEVVPVFSGLWAWLLVAFAAIASMFAMRRRAR